MPTGFALIQHAVLSNNDIKQPDTSASFMKLFIQQV